MRNEFNAEQLTTDGREWRGLYADRCIEDTDDGLEPARGRDALSYRVLRRERRPNEQDANSRGEVLIQMVEWDETCLWADWESFAAQRLCWAFYTRGGR